MDYSNFEDHIHAIILERGQEYFNRGAVKDIEETPEGWTMSIEGQSTYRVVLRGREQLSDWFCECPHAHGPVCKHVAAALYAIKGLRTADIDQYILALSESELRVFVSEQAAKFPAVFEALVHSSVLYPSPDEEE